jgi:hypothetical protein
MALDEHALAKLALERGVRLLEQSFKQRKDGE